MDDWWNQPMRRATSGPEPDGAGSGAGGGGNPTCPWCSAAAEPGANYCPSCGAIMAQRESLGGLVIPGVTDVDPGLRQRSLTGSMLGTQARMSVLSAVGQAADPSAQVATAAAMLARDSIEGMFRPATNPDDVGRPSQAALEMADRLGRSGQKPTAGASDELFGDAAPPDEPA